MNLYADSPAFGPRCYRAAGAFTVILGIRYPVLIWLVAQIPAWSDS